MSSPQVVRAATDARLLKRGCESLLGIAAGLLADDELNAKEIQFLSTWLTEHDEIAHSWPGEIVFKRVRELLSDGVITTVECEYLKNTLVDLVGGSFGDTGGIPCGSNRLPIDWSAAVAIPTAAFCFSGNFLFGTRTACESAVVSRGGTVSGITKKLDFLVIGELSSRDWKYSSYGTKIELALRLRDSGARLRIVSEGQWVMAL